MRKSVRTRSTQKLPRLRVPVRVMPRINAITTTIPAAADTKFWTVLPIMLVKWLMVSSPEYHCQFVFVTKLIAALNEPMALTPGRSVGLNGSTPCRRCMAYSTRTDTRLNARSDVA